MTFYDAITDFIFMEDQPQKADVIFVPGGNYPDSAKLAAKLYQEGWAPYVLPSGRYSKVVGHFEGPYDTEWDYLKDILMNNGVPSEAILKEDQATYTWENAKYSKVVLKDAGIPVKKAILCCQAFHARRAWMYYKQQFPDTDLIVVPVVTRNVRRKDWFLYPDTTKIVLGEVERIGQQFHCCLPYGTERDLSL